MFVPMDIARTNSSRATLQSCTYNDIIQPIPYSAHEGTKTPSESIEI